MAELQRVPVDRPLPRRWLPALGIGLAAAFALVTLKPWGGRPAGPMTAEASPPPSAAPAPTPAARARGYEPRLFGYREPDPRWELWPAGYVFQFGISGPLALASPESGAAPSPAPSPAPGAVPGAAVVDLGPADHLTALGINTPDHVRVAEIRLWRPLAGSCCRGSMRSAVVGVRIVRLPTLWDSATFHVIGLADRQVPGRLGRWPVGEYRLDLVMALGETLEIRFRVGEPAA
ncbi:MAG TPA: hypothetical protein VFX65_15140 [Candidatus Limnocylindrales bacterium]|nr:hypothetical protein [Candidatus Limnocylindrales bacterium]